MLEPPDLDPRTRAHAAFLLWMGNLALGTLLLANLLVHVPEVENLKMWLFALPALVSSVTILTLPLGLAFVLAARLLPWPRAIAFSQAGIWTVFQVLLFADTRVFNVFQYHFNGQIWNLFATGGSEDSIHLGWRVWTTVAAGLGGVSSLQLWSWRRILRFCARAAQRNERPLRPAIVLGLFLLPILFVEKTIYAQADLTRDRQITGLARLFPLYARVPMEDLASRVLGVDLEGPPRPRVELDGYRLDYPHAVPTLPPAPPDGGRRPNVLVVVIDCLRSDMLASETMPRVERWAEGGLRFEDHVSAGNSTRFGLFALLYGLHGSYWFPVLQAKAPPVLVQVLEREGYEFGVFSSASMNYPELRETAWVSIRERVFDDFAAESAWRRDEMAAGALCDWLGERDPSTPFFGFVLLDAPHQTYSYPPDEEPFTPAAEAVDYMSLTRNDGPPPELVEGVRNRYKNAVRHSDRVAARILERVAELGLEEDTLVFLTGDHGEEFLECGLFGHTSAFTPPQVAVPFVVRGPGIEPGRVDAPTSHLDFAPSVLEHLGADPALRPRWTLGENLFEAAAGGSELGEPGQRRRVLSGWNELGVWTPEGILRVPLSLFEFHVELFDYEWNLELDDADALARELETLERLGAECNRFLVGDRPD